MRDVRPGEIQKDQKNILILSSLCLLQDSPSSQSYIVCNHSFLRSLDISMSMKLGQAYRSR